MEIPPLNLRPGRVVEAEILRRFGTPVNFDPSSPLPEFFLVLSVGRCKFRLSPITVGCILQSVLGGSRHAYRVSQLNDRVFRFSVRSKQVGFHVFQLRNFECAEFRVFFHLWQNGGPNFKLEYRNWLAEEAAKWSEVARRTSSTQSKRPTHVPRPVRLTGANAFPVSGDRSVFSGDRRRPGPAVSIANNNNLKGHHASPSVFNRINLQHSTKHNNSGSPTVNVAITGSFQISNLARILGPPPVKGAPRVCSRCLNPAHQ